MIPNEPWALAMSRALDDESIMERRGQCASQCWPPSLRGGMREPECVESELAQVHQFSTRTGERVSGSF